MCGVTCSNRSSISGIEYHIHERGRASRGCLLVCYLVFWPKEHSPEGTMGFLAWFVLFFVQLYAQAGRYMCGFKHPGRLCCSCEDWCTADSAVVDL